MGKKEELSEQYRRKAYEVSPTRKRCQHNNEVIAWNNEIVGAFESGWDACVEDLYKNKGFPVDLNGNVVSYKQVMKNVELFNKHMKEEFLYKACEWLDGVIYDYMSIQNGNVDTYVDIDDNKFIEDFRKAMGD